ncbi:MAG: hypothetical protein HC898_11605 [Phycisphaerales bacterium]|nr:hypothetical protein [Phycisphaerales bacterium]
MTQAARWDDFFKEAPPLPPLDEALVEDYIRLGRPVDDLPYTPEFDDLLKQAKARGDKRDHRQIFQRLINLRKAARLPRSLIRSTPVTGITDDETQILLQLVEGTLRGAIGSRDQLPYSMEFDAIASSFNKQTGRQFDKHIVWRLMARIAK